MEGKRKDQEINENKFPVMKNFITEMYTHKCNGRITTIKILNAFLKKKDKVKIVLNT